MSTGAKAEPARGEVMQRLDEPRSTLAIGARVGVAEGDELAARAARRRRSWR